MIRNKESHRFNTRFKGQGMKVIHLWTGTAKMVKVNPTFCGLTAFGSQKPFAVFYHGPKKATCKKCLKIAFREKY